jgi:uncharacterized membrane protein
MEKIKSLLASRIFWASLVGLVMVMARAAMPTFPLENEALTQVLYLIGAFIFGEAVEGNAPGPETGCKRGGWSAALKSRKFWAAIVGALFVLLHSYYPTLALDETQVEQLVWVFVAFIGGVGLTDRMQKDDRSLMLQAGSSQAAPTPPTEVEHADA